MRDPQRLQADLDDGVTLWDERMHQLYGLAYADGIVSQEAWLGVIHPDDREATLENVNRCIAHDLPYVHEARVVLPGGAIRHVRSVGKIHSGQDGSRKLIGIAFDVSEDVILKENLKAAKEQADAKNVELEQAKTRIEHNALHDPLTALGNRRKLDDELTAIAELSEMVDVRVGILHIDLDRFKQINDTLGHAAGDALLVHASQVLRSSVRKGDLVARIGQGNARAAQGDWSGAAASFQQAAERHDSAAAWHNLGLALWQTGQRDAARSAARRALARAEAAEPAWREAAQKLVEQTGAP